MDRPIIFSAPEVRALLAGRKMMTRRVLRPQLGELDRPLKLEDGSWHVTDAQGGHMSPLNVPWADGDRLWVREAWRTSICCDDSRPSILEKPGNGFGWPIWYSADDGAVTWRGSTNGGLGFTTPGRHRASRYMPRWASRLTLDVTDVRVERLQAISTLDAQAEGMTRDAFVDGSAKGCDPRESFSLLWDELHGPGAWDANPWVAVISFTVRHANIDALDRAA